MKARVNVVLGFVGSTLDQGRGAARWERWRPTIGLCQQEDLVVHRLELFYQRPADTLTKSVIADIATISPETEVRRHLIDFRDPWDFEEVWNGLYEYARAYPFDTDREDYFIHLTTGTHVAQICMFLLAESRHIPARLIQTSPGSAPQVSPGSYQIVDLDLSRYDRIASRFSQEQKDALSFLKSGIETRSASFNRLIERIEQVAVRSREPFLLMGPTGAGKSWLAKRIFELKKARHQVDGAFVDVNCATLRGDGAMSALFGHVKGAFTGAQSDRGGLLRAADGGVLFLDEIGELGADEQAMLLRAIEEKVFFPLGSDRAVKSDFALIAGTNRDLGAAVREGRFRDDLLARINLWTFRLPSLRERSEDIEPNLQFELEQYSRRHEKVAFNKEARTRFLDFAISPAAAWSGNFRDLNGAVVRMATLARGGRITVDLVEEEIERLRTLWSSLRGDPGGSVLRAILSETEIEELDLFEQVQLALVIDVCRRSRSLSEAGRTLFAASRRERTSVNDADRLKKYLTRFGLDWDRVRAPQRS
ncbi:MAG: sigma 54-interacting transcriptional regulator [Acidobacteria bacterium]|nr:sigma 54-interacting transcriptional regulator [Acidobacteriota bacterium]